MILAVSCIVSIPGQSTDDDEYESPEKGKKGGIESSDEDAEEDIDHIVENSMSWKDNLAQKARTSYLDRQSNSTNLMKIVYGVFSAVSIIKLAI